jgi:hypothetical protein
VTYRNNVSDAARHAEKQLVLSRSSDLLGDARCAMLVRHAEKQLVSNILDKKKGDDHVVIALNVTS